MLMTCWRGWSLRSRSAPTNPAGRLPIPTGSTGNTRQGGRADRGAGGGSEAAPLIGWFNYGLCGFGVVFLRKFVV
jgi:hypothetical protein